MKIETLHVGMKVRHPQYGLGVVKTIAEAAADIEFNEGRRMVAPEAERTRTGGTPGGGPRIDMPLARFVAETVEATWTSWAWKSPKRC